MIAQLLQAALGIWLMAAPAVLGFDGPAATHHHVVGPLVASLAGAAVGQCTRGVRWWNLPLALWLIAAPLPAAFPLLATINAMATGAAVLALCCVRGKISHAFAGGWIALLRADPYRPPPGDLARRRSSAAPSSP